MNRIESEKKTVGMKGVGKKVLVFIPEMQEAELMYKLFDFVSGNLEEVNEFLYKQLYIMEI